MLALLLAFVVCLFSLFRLQMGLSSSLLDNLDSRPFIGLCCAQVVSVLITSFPN